jgi:hypothetical protein
MTGIAIMSGQYLFFRLIIGYYSEDNEAFGIRELENYGNKGCQVSKEGNKIS